MTLLASTSANAQIDVEPQPHKPVLILEGEQITLGSEGGQTGSVAVPKCVANPKASGCGSLGSANVDGGPTSPQGPATAAEIRRAVEEVGLPALAVRIQPGGRTLVNAPTIFFVDAPVFQHSTMLLGQAVTITGTPASFTWHHGDGTSQTTSKPGAPYPSTDVTHTYDAVATGLTPRVDVGYRVTYQVNGGAPLTIDQLITAVGPAASLDVAEARPVIVAP
ncbi:hypothetical protein [Aeromicrobium alkaliterrae]|uniref:PKD domain-containing protein n=1 Tax=Aeromicrobium alkaliterrae TaxID=302168 RepID=A0ABP4VRA9_9ACTN